MRQQAKAMLLRPDFGNRNALAAREAERREVRTQIFALAKRAEKAGFAVTAYLLDMAALNIGRDYDAFDGIEGRRSE